MLTGMVDNTGSKMTAQPAIHISQKRHSTHNCARAYPLPRVTTNSFASRSILRNADNCLGLTTVTYPGIPFPPHTPLYPSHGHIQAYLRSFASRFKLDPYIRFNHSLESAHWVGNASTGFWELSISTDGSQVDVIPPNRTLARDTRHRSRITKRFDHLVVGSGHNHYPKFPLWATDDAANQWLLNGKDRSIVHSIYFRDPEEYAGKIVLVVGSGVSGQEIVIQSSRHAKKV